MKKEITGKHENTSAESRQIVEEDSRNPGTEGAEKRREVAKEIGRIAARSTDVMVDSVSSVIRGVLKALGTVLLIFLLAGLIFACVFALYVKTCLTPELDVSLSDYKLNESSTIWYANASGEWQKLTSLTGRENRVWVDYNKIPKYMEQAVVSIEDKRFYDHKGVDWYRTAGAFVEMFATMRNSYGGSTITQQLIKNLTGNDEITVQRKLSEIFGALELEKKYDKKEIMEWYLNAVYFGEGCYGVQTAAHTYFGKDVSELSLAECASIVGITNKPTYYDPFYNEENNKERQETILRQMYEQGYIDYKTYKDACAEELVFSKSVDEEYTQEVYPYYVETVISDVIHDLMKLKGISESAARTLVFNGGYQIYSCYDSSIQSCVDTIYQDRASIPQTSGTQQLQSAIVIMDPYSGNIVALSGGVGEKTINFGLNRATETQRSPGSSFKPIASYGPATELGYITPKTIVRDAPDITLRGTSWYPRNDDGNNLGVVTIFQALQYSLNTVAAQIIDLIGPETAYNFLINKLGVTSLVPADCDYAPMALGQLTNGITVREMAQAYCAFVNDGTFTYGRTYTLVKSKDGETVIDNQPSTIQAFSENTAHIMTYMLENAVENGTGTEANLSNMPVAGKTGTSGDYKDRWFVGCTPYYVAAVWTGYDTPARIYTSGNPAARIWRNVMQPIHSTLEYKSFTYPYIGENTGAFSLYENEKGEVDTGEKQNNGENGRTAYTVDENSGGLIITPQTVPAEEPGDITIPGGAPTGPSSEGGNIVIIG